MEKPEKKKMEALVGLRMLPETREAIFRAAAKDKRTPANWMRATIELRLEAEQRKRA